MKPLAAVVIVGEAEQGLLALPDQVGVNDGVVTETLPVELKDKTYSEGGGGGGGGGNSQHMCY